MQIGSLKLPLVGLACAGLVGWAPAQHANTVFFGEASEQGLNLPSERRAVHPITAPYYNEDSFVTTDVRAWFVHHNFPSDVALAGGDARVYAVQLRAALTDKWQFVAYKDGWVELDTGLIDDSGLNDLAAGFKYNFLQDWETDTHAAAGLGYELGIGDEDVLQDDDEVRLWGSYNKGFDRLHLGATLNYLTPVGSEDALGDASRVFWHLHADYWVNQNFSPVFELNGYHVVSEGDNTPLPFSGVDVANLGGGDGEDVITNGLGFEWRFNSSLSARAAYEYPWTDNVDLFGSRITASVVWGF
jgi:hypothetical protein